MYSHDGFQNLNSQAELLETQTDESSDSSSLKLHNNEYSHLPNYYQDMWHFEEKLTDDEFLQIVIGRLQHMSSNLSYKRFEKEFLPQHRKPTFAEYLRFRKLENLISPTEIALLKNRENRKNRLRYD